MILIYEIKNVNFRNFNLKFNLNCFLGNFNFNFNFNLGRTEGTDAEEPLKTRSRMEQPLVKR